MHPSLIVHRAPAHPQFRISDEIKLSEEALTWFSSAFFSEIESKYL
jgi:hypothetical protein